MNEDWKKVQIKDIAKIIGGFAFKSKDFKANGDIPVVKIKSLKKEKIRIDRSACIDKIFLEIDSKYHINHNDILIALTGSHITLPSSAVGRVAKSQHRETLLLNQRVGKFIINSQLCNHDFLYYILISNYFFQSVGLRAKGAASQANISSDDVGSIKINLPPLPIQKRIADIFSAYDDLIENNLKRIKLLEQAAQNIYKEWFVHMRFPGHEDAVMDKETGLPEGWELNTFYEMVDIMSGGTPKTREHLFWNGGIPFFTPKDASAISQWYIEATQKTLTKEGLAKCNSKLYPIDTVFITARGTVGKVRLAMQPMAMNQSCYALKMKNDSSQYFLLGALQEAVRLLKKTAIGGVFDTIIVDTFKQIPFLQPTEKLINKFHKTVSPVIKQTATLSKEISKLESARDILLPRLMNRTIEV